MLPDIIQKLASGQGYYLTMLLDNVLGCVPTFSELWSTLHNARLDRLVDSENEDLVQWR